jgi:hypothetical protein
MPKLTGANESATYMLLHGYYPMDFKPASEEQQAKKDY